ncbi:MAG: DUF4147 domain-containing protein [Pseudomonadota bacterium]|nr:DUF4147 domain-containing protein [Pseudomonadota bacterium]
MSLREDVNKIYLNCLQELEPKKIVAQFFGGTKTIDNFERIFPIAFGKAAGSMMEGCLSRIPSKKIYKKPIVVTLKTSKKINHEADMCFSSHPTPNLSSVEGVEIVLKYLKDSKEKDLVLFLISGGGSSLLSKPSSNITLDDKIKITELLLKSGCTINEINIIRKHISSIKGGKLAEYAFPSHVISLIISDVINDDISSIASGPTAPDDSTFQDAINVLERYNLINKTPETITKHLNLGLLGKENETPSSGSKIFSNVENKIICGNKIFRENLADSAAKEGYTPVILNEDFVGEARKDAVKLSKIFLEKVNNLQNKKVAIISGGETIVKLKGRGKGGRNQEFALSFLQEAKNFPEKINWLLLSVGTDGIDGPTDAAGGLIDKLSITDYLKSSMNIISYLDNNDSYTFLDKINSIYKTGPTGTNVADIQIILIS